MKQNNEKLDQLVATSRQAQDERAQTYRERALKMYPHVCGRCAREFEGKNLKELTVHHRDHNHDNNPSDGSNWELLCVYCHDNEHQRQLEMHRSSSGSNDTDRKVATHNPFADLKSLLDSKS